MNDDWGEQAILDGLRSYKGNEVGSKLAQEALKLLGKMETEIVNLMSEVDKAETQLDRAQSRIADLEATMQDRAQEYALMRSRLSAVENQPPTAFEDLGFSKDESDAMAEKIVSEGQKDEKGRPMTYWGGKARIDGS